MIDFQEFLGRAILAARAGKVADARRNLNIAIQMQPRNPRAWLWLAAVPQSTAEQRLSLKRVLELDPSLLVAQVLLERLEGIDRAELSAPAQVHSFQCAQCGGRQRFDPDLAGLLCMSCGTVEPLAALEVPAGEQALSEALAQSSASQWAVLAGQITCDKCGAVTLLPAQEGTRSCPFCGSTQALVQGATPSLITPQAIVPFAFDVEAAAQYVQRWLSGGLFSPHDLKQLAYPRQLSGIYLPFWTFDGQVQIRCRVNYRLTPKTFTPTERIAAHGGWLREKLWYEHDLDDVLIYAGHSVPPAVIAELQPFELKTAVEYDVKFLADWQAEVYQLALADAAQAAHKRMRDQAMRSAAHHGIIPDYSVFLEDDSRIVERTFKLILLPVWIGSYLYHNQAFEVFINGQTGKVAGQKPLAGPQFRPPWRKHTTG